MGPSERPRQGVLDLTTRLLAETREELSKADAKAQILLASSGVVISVVLGGVIGGEWSPRDLNGWAEVLWWIGVFAAVLGVGSLGFAIFPRLLRNTEDRLTYFEDVRALGSVGELFKALEVEEEQGMRDVDQLWRLSKVVHQKYAAIQVAIGTLLFAILSCSVAALFG